MINSKQILNKLKTLALLPMLVISIGFVILIIQSYHDLHQFHAMQKDIAKIKNIDTLINEIQKERGISSGYIGSKGDKFYKELLLQQKQVDKAFINFIPTCNENNKEMFISQKLKLITVRENILKFKMSSSDSFDFYTAKIKKLENIYLNMTMNVKDIFIKNELQAYSNLTIMKESLGQIRGAFNGIFSLKSMDEKLFFRVVHAKGVYDSSLSRFEASSSIEMLQKLHTIISSPDYQFMDKILKRYSKNYKSELVQDPHEWFSRSTKVINDFFNLENIYFKKLDSYVEEKYNKAILELVFNISILLFISLIIFWLSVKIRNTIIKNIRLLDEYKDAVDRSSIVSKTDKFGRITYINDKFCAISGYTPEELIGKPHNIVRHPDMPRAAFKDLWNTILAKKPWSGIVKNRKKDGEAYTVEVTINPILNHEGEIEEFIAIRNDITNVLSLHEELENTQRDLIYKMGEIGETRSMETGFHVRRVAKYSKILAQYYGLNESEVKQLVFASPMHDIGKVGIPDNILNKTGKLTSDEWKIMQTHANIGYKLFKDSNKPLIRTAAIIAHEHHEKYDGTGYPRGLKENQIHIYGRITALADVFDALGSDRCYKKAWNDEEIFALIKEERGKHFDPDLVDIFFKYLDEFLAIRDFYKNKER